MGGAGRHGVLGVWSPDPTLARLASIGLGASAGTALVVDAATRDGGSGRTLADIEDQGPTAAEVSPGRAGVALIGAGDIDHSSMLDLCEVLSRRWPAIVVIAENTGWPIPVAPVVALVPGRFAPTTSLKRAVWQPVGTGRQPPGPGPVMPRLRATLALSLLNGSLPPRSRWIGAWTQVWEMPWE